MVFNPYPTKESHKVIFSVKSHSPKHPDLYLNSLAVEKVKTQNHLGLKQDEKLNFKEYLKDKFAVVKKGIGMLKELSNYLPRQSLVTLFEDINITLIFFYNKPKNMNIFNKIESREYNTALAITWGVRGLSKEKLYQELGFEYLSSRRWLRKLCLHYKIVNHFRMRFLKVHY